MSLLHHPELFVPLGRLVHVKPVVYEELVVSAQRLQGADGGDLAVAGVEGVHPLAVRLEAVVHLVGQRGAVVGNGLQLVGNIIERLWREPVVLTIM